MDREIYTFIPSMLSKLYVYVAYLGHWFAVVPNPLM